uniref:Uncharacterized protein K02A2.6-like n=1 Tax=Nicotiana tabacum TaxID=4097 RepID=A0A1S3ZAR2_TOBAC|nr:PREDICTED: uncharacterized protein K02A2.6-like [Nicotiana tabacum]
MPFGLKNTGATYQRLVTKMFKEQLEKMMEVYVDDMLVKSRRKEDHVDHLREAFGILRQYNMKLNPKKCAFGMASGKFLGFPVSQRGIEVNPNQIKAIDGIPEHLTTKKQVQKLTGYFAALSRVKTSSQIWGEVVKVALRFSARGQPSHKDFPNQGAEVTKIPYRNLLTTTRVRRMSTRPDSPSTEYRERRTPNDNKEAKKLRMQVARSNIVHNDLYKRTYGGPLAKCLGPNQTRRVLEEVHEGHCGAHSGN